MRTPMSRLVVIFVVLSAATVAILALAVRSAFQVHCESCVTFRGATACRTAAGRTQEEATRTAIDNACAFLASGMTDSVACSTASPASTRCD